jgi:hypothetical protein
MYCIQYALSLSFVVYVASSNLVRTDVYFHELVLKTHLWVRLKSVTLKRCLWRRRAGH